MTGESPRLNSEMSPRRRPILLVNDYEDGRDCMREALEDAGHVVIEAADGQQALNFLVSQSEQNVALIVLDLQMPVMDGWRLLELLRCYVRLASIPVIIVTGHAPQLDRVQHENVVGCFCEPYEQQALIDKVSESLAATQTSSSSSGFHSRVS
jgi:CheY-like chemotaxis protein